MERRKFPRLDASVEITWQKLSMVQVGKIAKSDISRNIARGGICITSRDNFRIGEPLHVTIKLPTDRKIEVSARVVWIKECTKLQGIDVKEFEVGLEFLRIDNKDREEVSKFIFDSFKNQ